MFTSCFVYCVMIIQQTNSQIVRDGRPIVRLPQGQITGTKVYGESGKLDAYFGIPYAAPPTGHLRFSPPQRHNGWNHTYQALEQRSKCPQLPLKDNLDTNEDCLYLNIWIPENAARFGPVPVVIIFEGKKFSKINKISITGQEFALEGIAAVTLTYRLNVFGFLSIGSPELRGNYGLIDQYFAMLWIKDNIKYFGGDPDKITLFGYSGGAASVLYHMISPRTSGLFQRVILSNGAVLSPWHYSNERFEPSTKIIRILGCESSYNQTVLKCLREKSTQDILRAYEEYTESGNFPISLLPVVDDFLSFNDRYLPVSPEEALKDGTYMQVPILTGISKLVADPQLTEWNELAELGFSNLVQFFEQSKIPEAIERYKFGALNKELTEDILKWHYVTGSNGNVKTLIEQMEDFEFETKIEAPHFSQLNYLSASFVEPIYVYYLDDLGLHLNKTDSTISADLLLLFGPHLLNQLGRRRFNPHEMRLSSQLKQLWSNFIIFGSPTPNKNTKVWHRYSSNGNYYIENFDTSNEYEESRRAQAVALWIKLLPKLNVKSVDIDLIGFRQSPDPAAGFRHAMYTLVALVVALLVLLLICVVLLKRRNKQNERHLHMGY